LGDNGRRHRGGDRRLGDCGRGALSFDGGLLARRHQEGGERYGEDAGHEMTSFRRQRAGLEEPGAPAVPSPFPWETGPGVRRAARARRRGAAPCPRWARLCQGAPVLISSWNINSIRARTDRLLAWLEARRPDVLCLQELKCTDEQFPTEQVRVLGYQAVVFGQRTYNGVAIVSRTPPEGVERGFHDGEDDGQARVLIATVGPLRIACLHAPNGQAVRS